MSLNRYELAMIAATAPLAPDDYVLIHPETLPRGLGAFRDQRNQHPDMPDDDKVIAALEKVLDEVEDLDEVDLYSPRDINTILPPDLSSDQVDKARHWLEQFQEADKKWFGRVLARQRDQQEVRNRNAVRRQTQWAALFAQMVTEELGSTLQTASTFEED